MAKFKSIDGVKIKLTNEEEIKLNEQEAKMEEEHKKYQAEYDAKQYQRDRVYPSIGDQLDMLWHSIDQDPALKSKYFSFYEAIKAVKVKHPKNG